MDIKKLYQCMSPSEIAIMKSILMEDNAIKKTTIPVFMKIFDDEIIHSLKTALELTYKGKYRYQCTFIEDLDVNQLTRFSGIGANRISMLQYLIKKHKNNNN